MKVRRNLAEWINDGICIIIIVITLVWAHHQYDEGFKDGRTSITTQNNGK